MTRYQPGDLDFLRLLEDNFDGEGITVPTEETIQRAINYHPKIEEIILAEKGITLGKPHYGPGGDRSVDLWWKEGNYELLLNVPPGDEEASYFGTFSNGKLKGTLD